MSDVLGAARTECAKLDKTPSEAEVATGRESANEVETTSETECYTI